MTLLRAKSSGIRWPACLAACTLRRPRAIGKWGDFGSENCMGPESAPVDPMTNKLLPRRDHPRARVWRRKAVGRSPVSRRKARLKWRATAKPQSRAT